MACGFGSNCALRWQVPPVMSPCQVGRIDEASTKSLATHPGVAMQAPQQASLDATDPLARSAPFSALPGRKVQLLDGLGSGGNGDGAGVGPWPLHLDSFSMESWIVAYLPQQRPDNESNGITQSAGAEKLGGQSELL